ncbi:MAG: 16S rRNA (guanine(966)-N(2))-methyltransferase RsmD [Bacilli bacterium]|nr:16S rRNA (guanine(966)-N(2))-methyltransferase RsmD [Bacilli bacterium]MDD3422747.1 16S rRNA (guanine(966)-N(2))-methyltransferase RsmD [Bacilli bacterium]MDD4066171.1 16S rRNA (guanine(966)-N(2))-methyltransferase RsmD [Bacilli bacterium]
MRIVAGQYGGRTIKTPEGQDTRPTLERVKQAMFSSIQNDIPGATVLDLFSGSGSLGIEALSRGANLVIFNDNNPEVVALIEENLATLKITKNYELNCLDYQRLLEQLAKRTIKFDVVLLDPPYKDLINQEIVSSLLRHNNLAEACVIIIETDRKTPSEDIVGFKRKEHAFGNVKFNVYRR